MSETKICTQCGKEFPMTSEYYHVKKTNKDGFRNECKNCIKEYGKKHYKENKEIIVLKHKQYYKNNKETIIKHNMKYRENNKKNYNKSRLKWIEINKQYMKEYKKQYYKNNKEAIIINKKQYIIDNKENIFKYQQKWREDNKENIAKKYKIYAKENKDKVNSINQRRRTRKHLLLSTLTIQQWEQTKTYFNNKCVYCGKELPLVQEHFIALSKGGEYTINNIIPSCKHCNSKKHDSNFFEWYPKYRYYSKKRETIILNFLHYKDNKQQLTLL